MPKIPGIDYQIQAAFSADITLDDNQLAPKNLLILDISVIKSYMIEYALVRDGKAETGRMFISGIGTDVSIQVENTATAELGVQFEAAIAGNDLTIKYKTTNTGHNAIFRYSLTKFGS